MNNLLLIGGLGGPEILLVFFAILLLFGGKKIPELESENSIVLAQLSKKN